MSRLNPFGNICATPSTSYSGGESQTGSSLETSVDQGKKRRPREGAKSSDSDTEDTNERLKDEKSDDEGEESESALLEDGRKRGKFEVELENTSKNKLKRYKGETDTSGLPHGKGEGEWPNGNKYEDDWAWGKPNGTGTMTYASGDKYIGEWVDGKKEGWGTITGEFERYEGERKNDGYDGFGTQTFTEGNRYSGWWKEGRRQGHGKWNSVDGSYEGEWKKDSCDGYGIMKYRDGNKYAGKWAADKPHGKGILTDARGNVLYQGNWTEGVGYHGETDSRGRPHGKGSGVMQDGVKYEENWKHGKRDGNGTQLWPLGSNEDFYTGNWKNGLRDGCGSQTYRDGSVYVGHWAEGQKQGQGRMVLHNGAVYEGEWLDDRINGENVYDEGSEGTPTHILWIDGGPVDEQK
ncbi:hypothetical protein AGMMS49949_05850 [Alphaproteobacteria bacterium]|nr:hypothetical protein AGMMS49949_05850 [Alphaproteobacteria bacterium]